MQRTNTALMHILTRRVNPNLTDTSFLPKCAFLWEVKTRKGTRVCMCVDSRAPRTIGI